MPERDAKLPCWDAETLEDNVQAYVTHYNSPINRFFNRLKWIQDEITAINLAMQFCSSMDDLPVNIWEQFHDRWRDALLLGLHINLSFLRLPGKSYPDFGTFELEEFLKADAMWLQKRPANN